MWSERHSCGFDRLRHSVDDVRRRLKYVGPSVIDQMRHGVFASKTSASQGEMLYRHRRSLAVYQISIHERVFEQRRDGVDVILSHLSNVLEQTRQRFQHAVLHVALGHAVLIHERR